MNAMDNDTADLTRRCRINGVLIRNDGLVCTFDATSWLGFCRITVETTDDFWGRDKGVARVFGCEDGRDLEEHTLADCRRTVEAHAKLGTKCTP